MKKFIQNTPSILKAGLIIIVLASALLTFLTFFIEDVSRDEGMYLIFTLFFELVIVAYFISGLIERNRAKKAGEEDWKKTFHKTLTICFVIFNISAYTLNHLIAVFGESDEFLTVFLILLNISFVLRIFKEHLPNTLNFVLAFILGMGIIFQLYQSISVFTYLPAVALFFVLGLTLHLLVPYIYCGILVKQFITEKEHKTAFIAGFGFTIIALCVFVLQYNKAQIRLKETIDLAHKNAEINQTSFPLEAASTITNHPLNKYLLKRGLVYQDHYSSDILRSSTKYGRYLHNPFVSIAYFFVDDFIEENDDEYYRNSRKRDILDIYYSEEERVSEERLWSGWNTSTKKIDTKIELYPEHRCSFTQIEFELKNTSRFQDDQDEAVYNLKLPNEACISSLSLWVDGVERPGILTTKQKADSAYKTIVGREKRDPSIVQWREGNNILFKVFPCTPKENRKVKIGITAPLVEMQNQLYYTSIGINGHNPFKAEHNVTLLNGSKFKKEIHTEGIDLKADFDNLSSSEDYKGLYTISIPSGAISQEQFIFGSKAYEIKELKRAWTKAKFTRAILDISTSWNEEEYNSICALLRSNGLPACYIKNGQLEAIDGFPEYLPKFNIIPFDQCTENDLFITKNYLEQPSFSELQNTGYYKNCLATLRKQKLYVFNIGPEANNLLSHFQEKQLIDIDFGRFEQINYFCKNHEFKSFESEDGSFALHKSGVSIKEIETTESNENNKAPDHLMRLYTYQSVLKDYYNQKTDSLTIEKAKTAHIVTPVTSLLVLETQADYDRFDIKQKEQSLNNATFSNSGSAPEPHEWALILILCIVVLYTQKEKIKNLSAKLLLKI